MDAALGWAASDERPSDRERSLQPGLFVLWEEGRREQDRILADLAQRFLVLHVYEIHWTTQLVPTNFQRFYSDLDVRGIYHVFNKGLGPFLAVTLVDRDPIQETRATSRGERLVNVRFLEAKLHYRDWLGGLGVHCGETLKETHRDLTMLLGEDPQTHIQKARGAWQGGIEVLERDVAGADGWTSMDQLWSVLNEAAAYVALGDAADVQLLTDEYPALHRILNAAPLAGTAAAHGGWFDVIVAGRPVRIGLRPMGQGWLDPRWEVELLKARQLGPDGAFRLPAREAFEWRAYSAFVHSPRPPAPAVAELEQAARQLGLSDWSREALAQPSRVKALLDTLVSARGYSYSQPNDPLVYFNHRLLGSPSPGLAQSRDALRRVCSGAIGRPWGHLRAAYQRSRDRVLLTAPWLRNLKRLVPGRNS